jgi:hypothetical protein
MEEVARRRLDTVLSHVRGNDSASMPLPVACGSKPPTPPVADMPEGAFFPSFPAMLEASKKHGGLFSYEIVGGRRMTVVADPKLFEIVFHPDEYGMTEGVGDAIKVRTQRGSVRNASSMEACAALVERSSTW